MHTSDKVCDPVNVLTFAELRGDVQEEVSATFQHTLTLQGGVGRPAPLAAAGTSTLHAVIITACRGTSNDLKHSTDRVTRR